jgi:hypothetical protein
MAHDQLAAMSELFKIIMAQGVTHDVLETRHVGGDGRRWFGDGSDNDQGGCCHAGEE